MNDQKRPHPSPNTLAAFVSGALSEKDTAQVETHLGVCSSCRELIQDLPGTTPVSFPGQPGQKAQGSSAPAQTAPNQEKESAGSRVKVPTELANHNRYRILGLVGVGGMGAVYKAEHRVMQRIVALKVINRNLTQQAAAVERFHREVKSAAKLLHPNIVTAYDAEQAGNTHFLVMEFVEGVSLSRQVKARGPLAIVHACHFVRQAAQGLQYAHELGMVHRDIKPHNLMLTRKGQVKILDFGLARFARESVQPSELTQEGAVVGTPDYIAPEQAMQPQNADIRADIYSLGCTMYFLLTGRAPFPEGTCLQKLMAHAERAPTPITELRPECPKELAAIVERMMAKDPAKRYQTPIEVAQALTPFIRKGGAGVDESSLVPATLSMAAPSPRRGRRGKWILVAGAVLLLMLIGGGGIGAFWLYGILTATGEVAFDSRDPELGIVLLKNGQEVAQLDGKGKDPVKLGTGTYDATLKPGQSGWRLEPKPILVERDGKVTIKPVPIGTVTIDSKVPEATVTIKRGGEVIQQGTADRQIELDAVEQKYEIELAEPRDGLQLKSSTGKLLGQKDGPFAVKRGEQITYAIVPVGAVIVTTRFPGAELTIKQGDKVVRGRTADTDITLEEGNYQIALAQPRDGLKLATKEVTIARGKTAEVKITSDWVNLLAGKDWSKNWTSYLADMSNKWVLKDGVLVGSGGHGYLLSKRDYANFHLQAEAMIIQERKGGIFFRASRMGNQNDDSNKKIPYGYELVLCYNQPNGQRTGTLIYRGAKSQPAVIQTVGKKLDPPDKKISLEVIASGNRIVIKVDGNEVVNKVQKPFATNGALALQVYGDDDAAEIKFLAIKIRELPADAR